MDEENVLTGPFETHRAHLRAVAYRILGSHAEADDAVQEAWLHLRRADTDGVENLRGWLTTVVARVCLDMLRTRTSRREEGLEVHAPDTLATDARSTDPEHETLLADSIGLALLVVLDTLAPAERVAFVLHDLFDLSFDEIAPIVGRSSTAARQLASRARRRVQGKSATEADTDPARHRAIVDAFLTAARGGDMEALLAILDPNVVLRPDAVAVETAAALQAQGAPALAPEVCGVTAVVGILAGRARGARAALVDGVVGAVWAPGGRPRGVFVFTIEHEKIVAIDVIAEPARIAGFDVTILED